MASTWKHPRSKYWTACFTTAAGRRLKLTTKETNRKAAQKIAEEYESAARVQKTARQVRETITRLHKELTGEGIKETTLRAYVGEWLDRKSAEVDPDGTLKFYKGRLEKFVEFMGADADRPLEWIARAHVEKYRNAVAKRLASKTANNDLKVVRMLFRAARRDALISEDPAEFVGAVRGTSDGEESGRQPYTLPQLQAVLAACDDEWRSMVLCSFYLGGQRLGDMAALKRSNVRLDHEEVRFKARKTGRLMALPLAVTLRQHLEKLLAEPGEPGAPLHPRAFEIVTRTRKVSRLSNQFAVILAAAGLRQARSRAGKGRGRDVAREKEGLSFHSLRHTATSLLHEAGLPPSAVREFVGHDDDDSHKGYTHVNRPSLERAAAALPDLMRGENFAVVPT